MVRFALPCLLLLAGCTMSAEDARRTDAADARAQAKLDKALAGYVAGEPRSCFDPRGASMEIYGETLLYRESGRRYWLNRPSGGCFGLRHDDIVVTRSVGTSQLCRGDIVRTVDRTSGFPSGACSFGEFVPYTRAGR